MPAIVILGMHRSGTSALAGLLQEAGVHLGDVAVRSPHNPLGNRELASVRTLHGRLLADAGGSWWSPPDRVVWSPAARLRRDRIIAGLSRRPLWGFKDPRTLFTLEGWLAGPGVPLPRSRPSKKPRTATAGAPRPGALPTECRSEAPCRASDPPARERRPVRPCPASSPRWSARSRFPSPPGSRRPGPDRPWTPGAS